MAFRKSTGERIFDTGNIIFLGLITLITLYPLLYVFFYSISDPVGMARAGALIWYPRGPVSFMCYRLVFKNPMIILGYRNTLFYIFLGTTLNFVLTAFGAFALSRPNLPGRKFFMLVMVFTMQFSGGIIPTYLVVNSLGLTDKIWAMIVPSAINTFNLIIMRTAFAGVPVELEESARMDGANDFTILFRIFIPVSMPVVATILLLYGVEHWNDFWSALIYLRSRALYPLQMVLREILIQQSSLEASLEGISQDRAYIAENIKYATIIVATIPILFLYPFMQKYFVKGVMVGSLKQ